MATSARLDELTKKFDENPRRYFAPLANEYRKLGDLTQAIALCRAHLPNQPGHISGHIVLAQALYEARELGESRQIFQASLDLDPENLIALRFLGDIAREQGEANDAREWYERVLEADPRNDEIALLLKELDLASGASAAAGIGTPDLPLYTPSEPQGAVPPTYATPTFMNTPVPARDAVATPSSDRVVAKAGDEVARESRDADASVVEARAVAPAAEEQNQLESELVLDFPEPEEILHDLPTGEALSFFEATTSDADYATTGEAVDDDPFFGAAASAGTAGADEVDVIASHSPEDDWFAMEVAAGTPTPVETHALSVEAPFEESFLPELRESTPRTSEGKADQAGDRERLTDAPAGETLTPVSGTRVQSNHPTPPFLQVMSSTDDIVPDESVDAHVDEHVDEHVEGERDLAEPFSSSSDVLPATAAHEQSARGDADLDEEFAFEQEGGFTGAPVAGAELARDDAAPESADTEEPTLEVEVVTALGAELESATTGVGTEDDVISAWESTRSAESEDAGVSSSEAGTAPSMSHDDDLLLEYGEFVPPVDEQVPFIAETFSVPLDTLDAADHVEAAEEAVEHVASRDSDAQEAVGVRAESLYVDAEPATEPEETAEALPELVAVDAEVSAPEDIVHSADLTVTPIEGLVSREVTDALERDESPVVAPGNDLEDENAHAAASVEGGASAGDRAVFVTETMAELYLQQGFHDEALGIYRQLLEQHPDDPALRDRVEALERGAASSVVDGIVPRDALDREGQSVRQFFAHFARQLPRKRAGATDGAVAAAPPIDSRPGEREGGTAGAANRDEALTVPDERSATPPLTAAESGAASLTQLFASGMVSGADEHAASALASAFTAPEAPPASRTAERELSLEHLFRDTPTRSPGAVTLDEYYQGASSGGTSPASSGPEDGEERGADIEQFTAWLEGLKKK